MTTTMTTTKSSSYHSQFKVIQDRCDNKKSIVLAKKKKKKTCRLVKLARRSRLSFMQLQLQPSDFPKVSKNTHWRKHILIKCCQENWVLCVEKRATRPLSIALYKKNQCQIDQNLYIKPQTLKLLEEKIGWALPHVVIRTL